MGDIIIVSIGGFFGAISRFACSKRVQKWNKSSFPAGTLTVNLFGAFLLGLFMGMQMNGHLYALLGIGFMGAFTTFSTLMLEAIQLKQTENTKLFYGYLVCSFIIGISLAFGGLSLGRNL